MLTGLKVLSLTCKRAFFLDKTIMQRGDPREPNFEDLEMQK